MNTRLLLVLVCGLLAVGVPTASWLVLRSSPPKGASVRKPRVLEPRASYMSSSAPKRARTAAESEAPALAVEKAVAEGAPSSSPRPAREDQRPRPAQATVERVERVDEPGKRAVAERKEARLRAVVESIRADAPGLDIAFTRCTETDCVARVESRLPSEIDSFVAAAKGSPLGFRTQVRERLSAFNGRTFQADLRAPAESIILD